MVIGGGRHIGLSLFAQASTIPSVIASEFREATSDIHRSALMALALILVTMAFLMAVMSRLLVRRTAKILSGGDTEVAGVTPAAGSN
jgi:phosphate transport system permease protein